MAKKGVRKPENRREALACLHTVAEHIEKTLKTYRAQRLPRQVAGDDAKSYGAARVRRFQRLADLLRLRRFVRAVKAHSSARNEKSLEQLLGLKPLPGRPVVQDRRDEILEKLLKIDLLRSEGLSWKEIGRALDTTAQAAKRLHERELPNLGEARARQRAKEKARSHANEIVARLEQRPPPIGTVKARNAALGKKIQARNRRAHRAKARRRKASPLNPRN
jgi:hypothetical protein